MIINQFRFHWPWFLAACAPPGSWYSQQVTSFSAPQAIDSPGGGEFAATLWGVAPAASLHVECYETWAGWWFGAFFIFPYIGNHQPVRIVGNNNQWLLGLLGILTPTDFHIFQRGWNHQPVRNLQETEQVDVFSLVHLPNLPVSSFSLVHLVDLHGLGMVWNCGHL